MVMKVPVFDVRSLPFIFIALVFPTTGCRIGSETHDLDYPTYGGSWQRTTRDAGRVGSIFDPGGAKVATLVDREDPPTPDFIERMKQSGESPLDPDRDPESSEQSPSNNFQEIDPTDELMRRELDDIEEEADAELRQRQLDQIEIRVKRKGPSA